MANGNIFISIPSADFNNLIPAELNWTLNRVSAPEDVEGPAVVESYVPTWNELSEANKGLYGAAVTVSVDGTEYMLLEMEASHINGEFSALKNLGNGLSVPSYTIYSATEARQFIADNAPSLEAE